MTGREAADRWTALRARWRKTISRLTPRVVQEYPFEVIAGVIAFLMGVPILLGLTNGSGVLIALVGRAILMIWAGMLAIGAVTIGVGLKKLHALALAAGLNLVAGCFGVYCVAVIALVGWEKGWATCAVYAVLGLISLARASYFRRIIDIQIGARQL